MCFVSVELNLFTSAEGGRDMTFRVIVSLVITQVLLWVPLSLRCRARGAQELHAVRQFFCVC